MREILSDIDQWREQGASIALATVTQTWGSAPRGIGAAMALTAEGQISGSVSGGCVEGAVIEEGAQAIRSNRAKLLRFGVADETAWEVGLACGGSIEVFVRPLNPLVYETVRAALVAEQPIANAIVVRGPVDLLGREFVLHDDGRAVGALGGDLDAAAIAETRDALREGRSKRVALAGVELFVNVMMPSPVLIAVGGVHIAIALVTLAKTIGYHTVVVDPRRAFGSEERFPAGRVDRLVQDWPDDALRAIGLTRSTAVAMLTHDPKLDDPGLMVALPSPAFYVGALGSRGTQEKRRQRLRAAGLSEEQINRLHGPIGLEIGARTPEEIALSIMAEIVAARNG